MNPTGTRRGFLTACLALATARAKSAGHNPRVVLHIHAGGRSRKTHLHIPERTLRASPPLVLALHGTGFTGEDMLDHYGWAAKAEREGFVVAAPDGVPLHPHLPSNLLANPHIWNAGQLDGKHAKRAEIDDLAFLKQLLGELSIKMPYDPERVYCVGHSNGGAMTFRLAADSSRKLAGIGMVAGLMTVREPQLEKPIPTLYIVGTRDPLMPLQGGTVVFPWGARKNPPVPSMLSKWAVGMACAPEPRKLSKRDAVVIEEYPSTNGGPNLTALFLEGHGHHWPGGKRELPEAVVGPIKSKLNATDVIWKYFADRATAEKRQDC